MSLLFNTANYGMSSKASQFFVPNNISFVVNKSLSSTFNSATHYVPNNHINSQLIPILIKQLIGLLKNHNATTKPLTQFEVLTPEQLALQGHPFEVYPNSEDYQLSQQQLLVKFESSIADQRGLNSKMEAELQKINQELNIESSFLRDAEEGWKIIQIKGKRQGQVLDKNTMDKIAEYMTNSPKIQYANVIGNAFPNLN